MVVVLVIAEVDGDEPGYGNQGNGYGSGGEDEGYNEGGNLGGGNYSGCGNWKLQWTTGIKLRTHEGGQC